MKPRVRWLRNPSRKARIRWLRNLRLYVMQTHDGSPPGFGRIGFGETPVEACARWLANG